MKKLRIKKSIKILLFSSFYLQTLHTVILPSPLSKVIPGMYGATQPHDRLSESAWHSSRHFEMEYASS